MPPPEKWPSRAVTAIPRPHSLMPANLSENPKSSGAADVPGIRKEGARRDARRIEESFRRPTFNWWDLIGSSNEIIKKENA